MPAPSPLIDAYLDGSATLRRAVAGMTRDQLLSQPVPGKWSTQQVVCHLADSELVGADRIKRIIALDRPQMPAYDEARFAAALAYDQRDLEEELDLIERIRRHTARLLRAVPAPAFERVGLHSEDGPKTLEQMVQRMVNHIPHHVKFIHEKRKALGLSA